MTQTFARPGTYMNTVPSRVSDRVQVAQTVGYAGSRYVPLTVHRYDLQSVAEAREEFGPTLADAQAFVQTTTCLECGLAACELAECFECEVKGCRCVIAEDYHDEKDRCTDCQRTCGGSCCQDW